VAICALKTLFLFDSYEAGCFCRSGFHPSDMMRKITADWSIGGQAEADAGEFQALVSSGKRRMTSCTIH